MEYNSTIGAAGQIAFGESGTISHLIASTSNPFCIVASIAFVAYLLKARIIDWYAFHKYPLLRKEASTRDRVNTFMADAGSLMKEGAEKYPTRPFRLTSPNGNADLHSQ